MTDDALVKTTNGSINGKSVGNVLVWKGIPYAKPPLGKLRFMAPEKPDSWQGVRETVDFSSVSVQKSREIMKFLGDNPMDSSEDCLYLNIWSPSPDEKRRPVLVWIHGGAFTNGSGSSPAYNGESFAEMGDIVVVTLNYRLGILGFLHLGELGEKDMQLLEIAVFLIRLLPWSGYMIILQHLGEIRIKLPLLVNQLEL